MGLRGDEEKIKLRAEEEEKVIAKREEINRAVMEVVAELKGYSAKEIYDKVDLLLNAKLDNEMKVARLLDIAIDHDLYEVKDIIGLMSKGDGPVEIGKFGQLLSGKATERIELSDAERMELDVLRGRIGLG